MGCGVVGGVVPRAGEEAVDERAVVGVEAQGVPASGGGAGCYGWDDGLEGQGPLDPGEGLNGGDGGEPEGVDSVEEGEGTFEGGGAVELAILIGIVSERASWWGGGGACHGKRKEFRKIGKDEPKPGGREGILLRCKIRCIRHPHRVAKLRLNGEEGFESRRPLRPGCVLDAVLDRIPNPTRVGETLYQARPLIVPFASIEICERL